MSGILKSILNFHKNETKCNFIFKMITIAFDKMDETGFGGGLGINKNPIYMQI